MKLRSDMNPRYLWLAILGLLAVVWNAYVWTTNDPPDLGAVVPIMGLGTLALIYIGSGIGWLTSKSQQKDQQPKAH